VDPVAVLRKIRGLKDPDPAQVVVLSELAGADGIAMQLRRDRKYLRERDMYILKELIRTRMALELPLVDTLLEVIEIGSTLPGVFHDVSFQVRAGEILGIAGLVGSKRSNVAEAIFGVHPAPIGDILIDGERTRGIVIEKNEPGRLK